MGDDADRSPAEQPGPQRPGLRVGHDERTAAMKALDAHFEAGRLDVSEYGERSGTAGSATYRHELEALFADLPAPHPEFEPEVGTAIQRPVDHRPVRYGHPALMLLPLIAVIGVVVLVATGGPPGALFFFPFLFIIAGRFGRRRF
jgi:hypothetical protein